MDCRVRAVARVPELGLNCTLATCTNDPAWELAWVSADDPEPRRWHPYCRWHARPHLPADLPAVPRPSPRADLDDWPA